MAVLGVIADDFTGATDIAGMLVKGGMRTIQTIGVPAKGTIPDDVDAVVVALKTRSIAAKEAVAQSLAALQALQGAGCVRFFFKYCSTFDSTDAGNIGPVGDALLEALGAKQAIYCPAFPENGRTIFFGHLFVGDVLLSDSSMRHHPLNPMTDASLVRVLARQTTHKVGLVALKQVQSGSASLREALDKLAVDGVRHVVVDAVADTDLGIIGEAVGDDPLVTGGSGVALGLPAAYRRRGLMAHKANADTLPKVTGDAAVLAGSCSAATLGQIAAFKGPHLHLDTDAIVRGEAVVDQALAWARDELGNGPILLSASERPEAVKALQAKYGVEKSSQAIEKTMAALAKGLVAAGVARHRRGGRRDLGRRGRRARRHGAAHRSGDRSRRAVDGVGRRQAAAAGAEVRQLRRARFLHQGVPTPMSTAEIEDARRDLRAGRQARRARPLPRHVGQYQRARGRRLADDARPTPRWANSSPASSPRSTSRASMSAAIRRPRKPCCIARSTTCGPRTAPSCIFIARTPWRSPASIRRATTTRRRHCRRSRPTS